MNSITRETRKSSYLKRPVTRAGEIMEVMGDRAMTARQICFELGAEDLNYVRPRLTELAAKGKGEVVGKVFDMSTGRYVAQWKVVTEGDEEDA